ncbi:hypothetical protein ACIPC1_40060 [Streptomyces sp. NPDC087263]|uniref:hypothetical protein n=1 Tax=Streptomyces sp. NPDC087263 TaxID=3365773 RepID=UPI0038052427
MREFHDRLRCQVRERLGRDVEPTAGVIDSQSVKADAPTAGRYLVAVGDVPLVASGENHWAPPAEN